MSTEFMIYPIVVKMLKLLKRYRFQPTVTDWVSKYTHNTHQLESWVSTEHCITEKQSRLEATGKIKRRLLQVGGGSYELGRSFFCNRRMARTMALGDDSSGMVFKMAAYCHAVTRSSTVRMRMTHAGVSLPHDSKGLKLTVSRVRRGGGWEGGLTEILVISPLDHRFQ